MNASRAALFMLLLSLCQAGFAAPPKFVPKAVPGITPRAEPKAPEGTVRELRPVSFSVNAIGKTPFIGALADVDLHPHVGFGAGYGYFSVGNVSGSFIPLYLMGYALDSNFSPFVQAGVDFVTVTFQSGSSLLNSTFRGTQFFLGGGLEYRFDFGLLLRLDAARFMDAKIWSPGASVGYSITVL